MKKRTLPIFLICYIAYVFIYVARLNLSMATPALKELAILNTAQVGLLGSMFSIVYACGRLVSGTLSDRIAPWIMISIGLAACGLSNIFFGLLPPFYGLLLLWGVNALAQSILWGSILRMLAAIYPENIVKKWSSYMVTAVAVGNLAGILLNTWLINRFGAQWAFLIPGGITLVITTFIILLTKRVDPEPAEKTVSGYGTLLKNKKLRQMLLPAVIHGVMKDNISLWMAVYIMERFGIDLEQSAYYILLIPAVGLLGRLLTTTFYSMTKNRERPMMVIFFAVCILASLLLVLFPISALFAVICLAAVYMAVSIINVCLLAIYPVQFASEGHVASVAGVLNFATYLGTGLSAIVYGVLIEHMAIMPCLSVGLDFPDRHLPSAAKEISQGHDKMSWPLTREKDTARRLCPLICLSD